MKSQANRFGAVAVVIGGSGFLASAVRSFLTGLRLVSPRTFDFRLHGKTSEILEVGFPPRTSTAPVNRSTRTAWAGSCWRSRRRSIGSSGAADDE